MAEEEQSHVWRVSWNGKRRLIWGLDRCLPTLWRVGARLSGLKMLSQIEFLREFLQRLE